MVRLETRMPSLRNSPRIRSAPQSRFCAAISLIKVTVSAGIFGLEDAALDLYFQNRRNPWRCHRKSVSGWTMKSACFHARDALARRTKIRRSVFANVGRLTCRRRMMSCCRRRAFSATSSDLLLARSVTVPNMREVLEGLVQSTKRWWNDRKHMCVKRLRKVTIFCTEYDSLLLKMSRYMPLDSTLLLGNRQGVEDVIRCSRRSRLPIGYYM